MKKTISLLLTAVMLLGLAALTASAVEVEGFQEPSYLAPGVTVTLDDSAEPVEWFTVTVSGVQNGKQYVLYVYDHDVGAVPTESDTLCYINQYVSADGVVKCGEFGSESNKPISFVGLASGTTYYVYLASDATDGSITGFTLVATLTYETNYTLGDVNEDSAIDVADAIMALRIYAGDLDASDNQRLAANVNGDGGVDVADAIGILRYYAGDISSFAEL